VATVPSAVAVRACSQSEIQSSIGRFFVTWNQRDRSAFESLFDTNAELDLATKQQDTLSEGPEGYRVAEGSNAILAPAAQQWSLGETLNYRGITLFANGGYADNVVATFRDGTTQRFDEAKFAYDCSDHGLSHVEVVSSGAAR
jgi:hypothetical protein